MQIMNSIKVLIALVLISSLTACGAVHTAVKKRNLDVQTKMSDTIFLEPVSPAKRIIYVDIRNTSDKELTIEQEVLARLNNSGFTVTDDPEAANYMLQANILQVGKSDLRTATGALQAGFGGAVAGAAIGSTMGSSYSSGRVVGGGLIGAGLAVVGDAMVDDTFYQMITDLQIRERPLKGEVITQTQDTDAAQGTATRLQQSVTGGQVQWKTYRTRVVSTANQVNLEFEEARKVLEDGLVRSVGGIF